MSMVRRLNQFPSRKLVSSLYAHGCTLICVMLSLGVGDDLVGPRLGDPLACVRSLPCNPFIAVLQISLSNSKHCRIID